MIINNYNKTLFIKTYSDYSNNYITHINIKITKMYNIRILNLYIIRTNNIKNIVINTIFFFFFNSTRENLLR